MKLTHAERVVDPASGATKGDVARYGEAITGQSRPCLACTR